MTTFTDFLNSSINESIINEESFDKVIYTENNSKEIGDNFTHKDDILGVIVDKKESVIYVLEDNRQNKILFGYYKNGNRIAVLTISKKSAQVFKNNL